MGQETFRGIETLNGSSRIEWSPFTQRCKSRSWFCWWRPNVPSDPSPRTAAMSAPSSMLALLMSQISDTEARPHPIIPGLFQFHRNPQTKKVQGKPFIFQSRCVKRHQTKYTKTQTVYGNPFVHLDSKKWLGKSVSDFVNRNQINTQTKKVLGKPVLFQSRFANRHQHFWIWAKHQLFGIWTD